MRLFCNLQPENPSGVVYHQLKGPRKPGSQPRTKAELKADVAEAMKQSPDPYEVMREKPGYTHITGATLILGDESCKGLRMGIHKEKESGEYQLGAGRCFLSGKKELADQGQTTVGFLEKIKKSVGYTMKIYSNAILQIGKYDILGSNDSPEKIYARMQKIWKMLDKNNMKIHACTIPPIEGATNEQEQRRQALNKLIKGTDEPLFNVIDLEEKLKHLRTTKAIKGQHLGETRMLREAPKTKKDKLAVAYLESLIDGGRDNFKEAEDPHFVGTPKEVSYVMVSDSFSKPIEKNLGGPKKSPGHYTTSISPEKPLDPQELPKNPGATTAKMAKELETKVIPSLTKKPGYRCAVIQAGGEDIMAPLPSDQHMNEAEKAIIKNLKQMYRRCLESNPPVMVVAVTLPPMSEYFDKHFSGEERRRHRKLWKKINDFIIKESHRLSQHPKDRYKRIMCVRAHDMVGTRKGYLRQKYKASNGSLNERGRRQMAMQIHKAINQMQVGIDFGKNVFGKKWQGPDYFLDEHDWEPPNKKVNIPMA